MNILKNKRIASLVIIAALAAISFSMDATAFRSSEVAFTDASPSGLAIVPASCPSDPHNAGECNPPTCSLSASPNPINQPNASTLSWSSTNSTSFHISNIGHVNSPGSTSVSPTTDTTYTGTVEGPGGSGSCSITLTVNSSCALPWGGTIGHGQSSTAYQASTVPYGQSCASQTRTCTDGTLSGTYQYQSCSVAAPANCSLNGVTVNHGSSYTFYSTQTAPSGQLCSSYAETRTCTNGVLSGSSSFQYGSCGCTASTAYTCSPQNVVQTVTATNCAVTVSNPYATCASPSYCSAGSSTCLNPPLTFVPSGNFSGHLQLRPELIRSNQPAKLYWNIANVSSCTVSGTNGDSWSGAAAGCADSVCTSGVDGQLTSGITAQTVFSLTCTALPDTIPTTVTEAAIVNIAPKFCEVGAVGCLDTQ